jgi:hypothetical protein
MSTSKRQNIAGSIFFVTFRGVATVDSDNILRTFRLDNLETLREEIVSASTKRLQNISIQDFLDKSIDYNTSGCASKIVLSSRFYK